MKNVIATKLNTGFLTKCCCPTDGAERIIIHTVWKVLDLSLFFTVLVQTGQTLLLIEKTFAIMAAWFHNVTAKLLQL